MEYETLAEYHNIARKAISKFASKMYPSMLKKCWMMMSLLER